MKKGSCSKATKVSNQFAPRLSMKVLKVRRGCLLIIIKSVEISDWGGKDFFFFFSFTKFCEYFFFVNKLLFALPEKYPGAIIPNYRFHVLPISPLLFCLLLLATTLLCAFFSFVFLPWFLFFCNEFHVLISLEHSPGTSLSKVTWVWCNITKVQT